MLTSIHPLGERARNNRWWLTVAAFAGASVTVAATVGAALGTAGSWVLPDDAFAGPVAGLLIVLAAGLDLARVPAPGPRRQVNERWIGVYRGWVYGAGFGAQLGAGLATFVVTWLVYATLAAELLAGSPAAGALIGAAFGVGRALPLLVASHVDRPSRLVATSATMARIARPAFSVLAAGAALLGVTGIVIGVT